MMIRPVMLAAEDPHRPPATRPVAIRRASGWCFLDSASRSQRDVAEPLENARPIIRLAAEAEAT